VIGHVGRRHRVAGSTRRGYGRFVRHFSGCGMCSDGRLLCGADRDLASCPRPCNLDRTSRSIVGTALFKKGQHMFGTVGRPSRQETVFGDIKRAAAMDCNKTPVAHVWFSDA
jgi:hypothetical protein